MPTKQLLVASVFAPNERNESWIDLQLRFLRRTTADFDHAVYLNRVSPELFQDSIIIERCELPFTSPTVDHSRGLNEIIRFFRRNPHYENYLILDCDAFPVTEGWLDKIVSRMKGTGRVPPNASAKDIRARSRLSEKHFAATVRTENLDTFPHPSVFFIRGEFLRKRGLLRRRSWDFRRPSPWRHPRSYSNLLGFPVRPVGAGISPRYRGRHVLLPLVRTNVWNPHPIIAAIYGGLFYHHGAGSRNPGFRLLKLDYADDVPSASATKEIEQQLYAELLEDPVGLIRRLRGQSYGAGSTLDFSAFDRGNFPIE